MIFIQDDFSGLLPISQSFFPNADVQLCAVHMQRNAKTHLSKTDSTEFQQRWRAIKSSWDVEVGHRQFEELCDRFAKAYPTWMGELRKKREHYLAFLKYPEYMRKSFSTTNLVEAINGQLEIMRRNSGGYFHSEETLKFKLGLAISSLRRVDGEPLHTASPRLFLSSMPCFNLVLRRPDELPIKHNFVDKSQSRRHAGLIHPQCVRPAGPGSVGTARNNGPAASPPPTT